MQEALEREIVRHARRVLKRLELKRWLGRKFARSYQKRTGQEAAAKAIASPDTWNLHPHFDPKYCIAHSKFLARTIWKKIEQGTYEPVPAVAKFIPKPNGELRQIMVFAVPDAAVAKLFRARLTKRNAKNLSANSYAYCFDKNLFDALLYMQAAVKGKKNFLIQYDFRKYFDSINHSYLRHIIESERIFLTSQIERYVISAFLKHRFAEKDDYQKRSFERKDVGIPQGSSLSLWLANVAGHELDRDLERQNGQFARYADDVVCVAHSYEDALHIADAFDAHCERAGLQINREKSPGICILGDGAAPEEMRSVSSFDYLGHKLSQSGISLTDKAIKRIKQRISRIIQVHLLHYPKGHRKFNAKRVGRPHFDWDLVTCLNELRRYIYGGHREADLDALIFKNVRLRKVKGLMSFYVLISDPIQLRDLDGWLITSLRRALVERYRILRTDFGVRIRKPQTKSIKSGDWYQYKAIKCETRCPSFLRGWRGARKYYFRFGLGDVVPPKYYGY